MKKAAIIGGTGYGAIELLRLLRTHTHLEVTKIISQSQEGQYLELNYPHLLTFYDRPLEKYNAEELIEEVDVVFFATPAGVASQLAEKLVEAGLQCIDLSGDFRLPDQALYEKWYGKTAPESNILKKAVFGLSEIYSEKIKHATLLSNPGCFPTSALLGLIPALRKNWITTDSIIIDGKTGVSGAGRSQTSLTHFSETNDNLQPYKIGKHQHIPEIEHYLSIEAGKDIQVTLTTHLIPMTRGLLCTIYTKLNQTLTTDQAIKMYQDFYKNDPFVRVRSLNSIPATKHVTGSNYCDIGLVVDERTNQLIIISAIDNLVKGAAGQAIQNVNLMNNWDIGNGLQALPIYP